jgi:biopolymer transport protein ExbD
MALKTRNKIQAGFSMSGMTDIVFLLLIFFMITSTLIAPNALKLLLPQSQHQTMSNPITTVSITRNFEYYVETSQVEFSDLERVLRERLSGEAEPTISLHVDRSVPMEQVVNVMNIAKDNRYRLILATSAR